MSRRRPSPYRRKPWDPWPPVPTCGATPDPFDPSTHAVRCGLPRRHAEADHVAQGDGWVWRWPASRQRRIAS